MGSLANINEAELFKYFEEITAIPHGSGNMDKISEYCVKFAEKNGLRVVCDDAKNVIIYKPASKGCEGKAPIILQGHIDMVCQKTDESEIDFENDGLDVYVDGDFIKAKGTTLGADNGIAVAMIMTILADTKLAHPPIEAVFTTDEEIGMIGASALDVSLLKGKRMINLDAEEANFVTVSCAGGSDFTLSIPVVHKISKGTKFVLEIKNLKGGHSGIEIDKGRVNASIIAGRLLDFAKKSYDFDVIRVDGGSKSNAITVGCTAELLVRDSSGFVKYMEDYFHVVKEELSDREETLDLFLREEGIGEYDALTSDVSDKLIYILLMTPNGIADMSASIEGLVETSLNLGILKTEEDRVYIQYALRSNKKTALDFLQDKLSTFAIYNKCTFEVGGRYEPWEFKEDSKLKDLYIECFDEKFGYKPSVVAIHAGLECAVFSSRIDDIDCIAVGPDMFGVHTVEERLSISSTEKIFNLLCNLLEKCE